MQNSTYEPLKNRIMDQRVNMIDGCYRCMGKKSVNETKRLPVQYSVGSDYLYTYRTYDVRRKYINREITKEQYEQLISVLRNKRTSSNDGKVNRFDALALQNRRLR